MNSSNKKLHSLSQFERQLCGIQGKMFELSAKKNFSSKEFIDFYSSESIVKKCNAEMMHTLYPAYHTLDCAQAIKRIIEA